MSDTVKILKEIKLSNQQTKEEVKELLDKYLEGSKLTTDFASLPSDVRETAARYGVVSGTKSEWENFFMRLAYHESGFFVILFYILMAIFRTFNEINN